MQKQRRHPPICRSSCTYGRRSFTVDIYRCPGVRRSQLSEFVRLCPQQVYHLLKVNSVSFQEPFHTTRLYSITFPCSLSNISPFRHTYISGITIPTLIAMIVDTATGLVDEVFGFYFNCCDCYLFFTDVKYTSEKSEYPHAGPGAQDSGVYTQGMESILGDQ